MHLIFSDSTFGMTICMFLCVDILNGTIQTEGRKVVHFDFKPMGEFDLFVTGHSHFSSASAGYCSKMH